VATDATVPCISFTGSSSGRFFGFSMDHLNPHCNALISIQDSNGPLHLYQPSIEHLATYAQVDVHRSKNVHLHAFKFECEPLPEFKAPWSQWTGGLIKFHNCDDVSIFGGSGNYGIMDPNLSHDIIGAYNTPTITVMAMVRAPVEDEASDSYWVRTVKVTGTGANAIRQQHNVSDNPPSCFGSVRNGSISTNEGRINN